MYLTQWIFCFPPLSKKNALWKGWRPILFGTSEPSRHPLPEARLPGDEARLPSLTGAWSFSLPSEHIPFWTHLEFSLTGTLKIQDLVFTTRRHGSKICTWSHEQWINPCALSIPLFKARTIIFMGIRGPKLAESILVQSTLFKEMEELTP